MKYQEQTHYGETQLSEEGNMKFKLSKTLKGIYIWFEEDYARDIQ